MPQHTQPEGIDRWRHSCTPFSPEDEATTEQHVEPVERETQDAKHDDHRHGLLRSEVCLRVSDDKAEPAALADQLGDGDHDQHDRRCDTKPGEDPRKGGRGDDVLDHPQRRGADVSGEREVVRIDRLRSRVRVERDRERTLEGDLPDLGSTAEAKRSDHHRVQGDLRDRVQPGEHRLERCVDPSIAGHRHPDDDTDGQRKAEPGEPSEQGEPRMEPQVAPIR